MGYIFDDDANKYYDTEEGFYIDDIVEYIEEKLKEVTSERERTVSGYAEVQLKLLRRITELEDKYNAFHALEKRFAIAMEAVDKCYCAWGKVYPDICGNCEAKKQIEGS